jgi:hypothetical protein
MNLGYIFPSNPKDILNANFKWNSRDEMDLTKMVVT